MTTEDIKQIDDSFKAMKLATFQLLDTCKEKGLYATVHDLAWLLIEMAEIESALIEGLSKNEKPASIARGWTLNTTWPPAFSEEEYQRVKESIEQVIAKTGVILKKPL